MLFACVLAWGMLIGSCRWLVRVGDGARWSVFLGAGRLGRSRPTLAQARIDVPAGVRTVTIRVQYLRGLSGFAPIDG